MTRAVIYGGNGFVGTHVAEMLTADGVVVVSVSRSGKMPEHLVGSAWAEKVDWRSGDAAQPDTRLLAESDVLISVIGAPPLPTFSSKGYQQSVHTNGQANASVIQAAGESGIRSLVLLGAKIPSFINKQWFAYAQGKKIALEAAQHFTTFSDEHRATVLQPGGIYGKRHTKSGREIPIDWVMKPIATLLPSQLLSVERVARCVADVAMGRRAYANSFTIISHQDI